MSGQSLLVAGDGRALAMALPAWPARAAGAPNEYRLAAAFGRVSLVGGSGPMTDVWSYNGQAPGPEIRVRQGQRLRVVFENRLAEATTIHWHGLRVPNAMNGVPHLTQQPIARGQTFAYELDVPEAGTYWYHPHQCSFEQVGRSLCAPLIIKERSAGPVDRDVT